MNLDKLRNYIQEYKNKFLDNFKEERYKWRAVKHFQENWDINADNFEEMYNNATKYERNLLTQSAPKLPKKMINHFVDEGWENEVKKAFSVLFDETKDINIRIDHFINIMNEINVQRNNENQRNDISAHEDLNIASVYLWLKYPDKYYMYKPNVCENILKVLDCDYKILHKRNKNANKINFEKTQEMYKQIQNEILKDNELQYILKTNLNYQEEYNDEKYHILAQDIGYFINKIEEKNKIKNKVWIFEAGEDNKLWDDFYKDGIMAVGWDDVGYLKNYKNKIELKNKIQELNKTPNNDYKNRVKALWDICNTISIDDIVYVKNGQRDIIGRGVVNSEYIYDESRKGYEHIRKVNWTSRAEFKNVRDKIFANKALTELEDMELCLKLENLYKNGDNKMTNQPLNQILYGPPGTGKTWETKKIIKSVINPGTTDNNTNDLSWWQAVALAMYNKDKTKLYKVSEIKNLLKDYIETKNNANVDQMLWGLLQEHVDYSSKTVFYTKRRKPFLFDKVKTENKKDSLWKLTEDGINYIENQLLDIEPFEHTSYQKDKHIEFITFHQSYSYEEFIEGIKPIIDDESNDVKYKVVNGIFKQMCIRANAAKDEKFMIIIDEINRGNISKIFGELITLIEDDKRIISNNANNDDDENMIIDENSKDENSIVVTLPYSQEEFGVPNNLYIVGTMNTSDRSIASVDIALRRRFKFKEMMPKESCVDDEKIKFENGKTIRDIFNLLNKRICALLDRDHQIGHSYFIGVDSIEKLKDVWFDNVLPLLNEYFYGDWEKLQAILGKAEENDNGYSFIQRFDTTNLFTDNNVCDESYYCDFRNKSEYDDKKFIRALLYAFYNIKPEKEQDKQNKDGQE